ncbi:MAG: amidohydrolase, partial [Ferruginibacter sp.]
MKKIIFYISCLFAITNVTAQETMSPAPAQNGAIALTNATIHVGNGQVINNGTVVFKNGRITEVGADVSAQGAKVIDCKGKQVYPGLILTASQLGLIEVSSTRATIDATEIGEMNPSIRSLV